MSKQDNIIESIKEAVDIIVEEKKIVTTNDLKFLPTRDEFNSRMDELMGEIKVVREEISILSQHSRDHSDEIENLKKIHPNNSHPVFS